MKIRVAVIFGGESVEHEISIISALQAIENFDIEKYEVIPVYIAKNNEWYVGNVLKDIKNYTDLDFIVKNAKRVKLITNKHRYFLYEYPFKAFAKKPIAEFDVAFPIVHGTNVEDGILQGLLEANRIPYAGPKVSSAAVGQDKVLMKMIWQAADLPILPFVWLFKEQWEEDKTNYVEALVKELDFPMIIKPACLGSSVGISIAHTKTELIASIDEATKYDKKIVIEKALTNFTEMNCSVLGDGINVEVSEIEKVFTGEELLSYQEKYQGDSAKSKTGKLVNNNSKNSPKLSGGMANTSREMPANVSEEVRKNVQALAKLSFVTLGMSGVSRIDFLMDNETSEIYLNEINTIPGSLSFYLWQATGKSFKELLTNLIDVAIKQFKEREKNTYTYDTNVLATHTQNVQGTKGKK